MSAIVEQLQTPRARVFVPLMLISVFLCAFGAWQVSALAIVAGLAGVAVLYYTDAVLRGRIHIPLLAWVLLFPLGYYFLSFPRERAIFSWDRFSVIMLLLAVALASPGSTWNIPTKLKRAAIFWSAFLAACAISLVHSENVISGVRGTLDIFALPAVLGYCVLTGFDVKRYLKPLHVLFCVIMMYCAAIGIYEFTHDVDVMELRGAIFYHAGSDPTLVPRVNGPFQTNNSFGLIGLMAAVMLICFWSRIQYQSGAWHRLLHRIGVVAALVVAVLPLFRSIFLSAILVLILDTFFSESKGSVVRRRIGLVSIVVVTLITAKWIAPLVFESRSNSENIFQRIAQQGQTLDIFLTSPITGIGLGQFLTRAENFNSQASFAGLEPGNAAHNNFGQVLTETGLLGAFPYITAQIMLFSAFSRYRSGRPRRTVWKYAVYLFAIYILNGMALSSGYYSDLNLWFVFCTATVYKLGMQETIE